MKERGEKSAIKAAPRCRGALQLISRGYAALLIKAVAKLKVSRYAWRGRSQFIIRRLKPTRMVLALFSDIRSEPSLTSKGLQRIANSSPGRGYCNFSAGRVRSTAAFAWQRKSIPNQYARAIEKAGPHIALFARPSRRNPFDNDIALFHGRILIRATKGREIRTLKGRWKIKSTRNRLAAIAPSLIARSITAITADGYKQRRSNSRALVFNARKQVLWFKHA